MFQLCACKVRLKRLPFELLFKAFCCLDLFFAWKFLFCYYYFNFQLEIIDLWEWVFHELLMKSVAMEEKWRCALIWLINPQHKIVLWRNEEFTVADFCVLKTYNHVIMGIQEFLTLNKNELFTALIQNKARRHLEIKKCLVNLSKSSSNDTIWHMHQIQSWFA